MKNVKLVFLLFISMMCASCAELINDRGNTSGKTTLRVLSYNIHHCNPPSKPDFIDVDAIAATIKAQKPDLVALQEVDANTGRSGKINQAEVLARKLGMNFYFAKAIDHDGGDYGVAILSRFPISEMHTSKLPTIASTKGEPRVLATAKVTLPNGKVLKFASTHLDAQRSDENRLAQIKEINSIVEKESLPMIIGGDFNAVTSSEVMKIFGEQFKSTCFECDFTIPVLNPNKTIDFIGFKPVSVFHIVSHRAIPERYASDHLPVLSVLYF